jgi:TrmH RNA methyltransferase
MKNKLNKELAVCGFAAVKNLEKNNKEKIRRLYFTQDRAPLFGGLCKYLSKRKAPYNLVEPKELEKLCGSIHHQGVVAMIDEPEIKQLSSKEISLWIKNKQHAILLDRIGNANNLGAIVRSAAFFGIKNIIIPDDEAQSSITTSSYRVAEGGMEFVNIFSTSSSIKLLKDVEGKMVRIGTDLSARKTVSAIHGLCKSKSALIILGNEERGISEKVRENCDELVIIPFLGMNEGKSSQVESLNVAQAASIILYELSKDEFYRK